MDVFVRILSFQISDILLFQKSITPVRRKTPVELEPRFGQINTLSKFLRATRLRLWYVNQDMPRTARETSQGSGQSPTSDSDYYSTGLQGCQSRHLCHCRFCFILGVDWTDGNKPVQGWLGQVQGPRREADTVQRACALLSVPKLESEIVGQGFSPS